MVLLGHLYPTQPKIYDFTHQPYIFFSISNIHSLYLNPVSRSIGRYNSWNVINEGWIKRQELYVHTTFKRRTGMDNLFGASKVNLRTNEKSQTREGYKIFFHEQKSIDFEMIWKALQVTTMNVENEKRSIASIGESRFIADSNLWQITIQEGFSNLGKENLMNFADSNQILHFLVTFKKFHKWST